LFLDLLPDFIELLLQLCEVRLLLSLLNHVRVAFEVRLRVLLRLAALHELHGGLDIVGLCGLELLIVVERVRSGLH